MCNVFVPNCVANACPEALACHVHIVQNTFAICAKYFCTLLTNIAVHARNPVCPAETRKICFLDKESLYIIPISSQQRSKPRRARFAQKSFQIYVPTSVKFLQDFSQNLPLLMSGNSLGKQMGKKQFFLYVAPAPIGTTQYMSTLLNLVAGV